MQTIIVYIIVSLAVICTGKHIWEFFCKKNKSKGKGCGCGCSGCSLAQKSGSCLNKF